MDVRCAFLNRKPDKELFILRPKGYTENQLAFMFKLNRSLYGLKQSPQCWHKELRKSLMEISLRPTETDPFLYHSKDPDKKMWLFIHENEYISLIQDKFISNILKEFGLEKSRPANNPLPGNIKSFRSLPCKEMDPAPFNYRWVVGLLQYLVQCTRTDLAFSTSFLSQFLESPKDIHYNAARHVLTYLNSTAHFSLRLGGNNLQHSNNHLLGFSNSDWGGAEGYKSFSASIIYCHGTIGWRSHKQKVVALSSAEAEYNALSENAQDLEWMRNLIFEATNRKV
ncbi:hypothetical protein O181_019585 [Austropuccinia psidii MF-1]|uniref:Reverse transcriptase Ty1/copia-type domain-containing protein n=1 Tax=Austropuccinia psidii MF-1 TaxID=1389203 RepID=A0A9Q3CAY7_9BASI|nr:hypothetical protein [Austropuccinia psidii MF-1]